MKKTVWAVHRYVSGEPSDGGKTWVPTLKVREQSGLMSEVVSSEGKSKVFEKAFFLDMATMALTSEATIYPNPKFEFRHITDDQIGWEIGRLSPYKAPGADRVLNAIYMRCADLLIPHLGLLYRANFELGTYPDEWKDSITVVVRKPGKPDYTTLGAYRPIALLSTMGKILSSCIAGEIARMAELHNLLPNNHFGCRPGR